MHPDDSDPVRAPGRLSTPDLSRIALAIDALTFDRGSPTMVHVDLGPDPFDRGAMAEIGLTPLPGASSLADVMAELEGWRTPRTWYVVGVSVSASVRTICADAHQGPNHPAWLVHLVGRRGERATRLSVPDAPHLSGPTDGFADDSPLDRCLRRLLGGRRRG